jgi:serine/threonine protein kinase
VELVDVRRSSKWVYLILEYAAGGDLSQLLNSQPGRRLAERDARAIFQQVAAGLQALWSRRLVHRDIKPQNLLLSSPWTAESSASAAPTVKIADFGFARHLAIADMAETLCGTPLYMAPELLKFQRYDSRCDLWSAGVVLFEMLAGKTPFVGSNPMELLHTIQSAPSPGCPTFPKEVSVSDEALAVLDGLLQRDPSKRMTIPELMALPFVSGTVRSVPRRTKPASPPPQESVLSSSEAQPVQEEDSASPPPEQLSLGVFGIPPPDDYGHSNGSGSRLLSPPVRAVQLITVHPAERGVSFATTSMGSSTLRGGVFIASTELQHASVMSEKAPSFFTARWFSADDAVPVDATQVVSPGSPTLASSTATTPSSPRASPSSSPSVPSAVVRAVTQAGRALWASALCRPTIMNLRDPDAAFTHFPLPSRFIIPMASIHTWELATFDQSVADTVSRAAWAAAVLFRCLLELIDPDDDEAPNLANSAAECERLAMAGPIREWTLHREEKVSTKPAPPSLQGALLCAELAAELLHHSAGTSVVSPGTSPRMQQNAVGLACAALAMSAHASEGCGELDPWSLQLCEALVVS